MVPGFCRNVYKSRLTENLSPTIELLLYRIDRSLFAVLAHSLESEDTVAGRKERIVAALADIGAGMDLGTSLTNQYVAREDELTVASLDAKTLGFGISAVLGGAHTFFMSEKLYIDLQHY